MVKKLCMLCLGLVAMMASMVALPTNVFAADTFPTSGELVLSGPYPYNYLIGEYRITEVNTDSPGLDVNSSGRYFVYPDEIGTVVRIGWCTDDPGSLQAGLVSAPANTRFARAIEDWNSNKGNSEALVGLTFYIDEWRRTAVVYVDDPQRDEEALHTEHIIFGGTKDKILVFRNDYDDSNRNRDLMFVMERIN